MKILRKPFLPMVILKHLLTGFITPKTRSIHVLRKLFTSAFLSLDIMAYRSVHNLVKFLLLFTNIFPYVLYSVPLVAFLASFHLKTCKTLIALRSHVVYQFTCQCCSALHVGQTRPHIQTRISCRAYASLAFNWKRTLYINHA